MSINPPFDIGIIKEIRSEEGKHKVRLKLKMLLRPQNIQCLKDVAFGKDLNMLYWSDIHHVINANEIEGKCFVRSEQRIIDSGETIESWTKNGEFRFYFKEFYDKKSKVVTNNLPDEAKKYGASVKKLKSDKDLENEELKLLENGTFPKIDRPLQALDVFAGKLF